LPEGVPERLKRIVASARLVKGDAVLDVGTGTGILVPLIQAYEPEVIFACDLSEAMLAHCYPNIADKPRSFENISRMTRPGGRMVISHPMGKSFIDLLREESPFPLDDFPKKSEAEALLEPSGFLIQEFIDEPMIYILVATRQNSC
jgi:cyclopropane fatty-acyl-phospholipid synthase-like methyltransferase